MAANTVINEYQIQNANNVGVSMDEDHRSYSQRVASVLKSSEDNKWDKTRTVAAITAVPMSQKMWDYLPGDLFRERNADSIYEMVVAGRTYQDVYGDVNKDMKNNTLPWFQNSFFALLLTGGVGGVSAVARDNVIRKAQNKLEDEYENEFGHRSKREMTLLNEALSARKNGERVNEATAVNLLKDLYADQAVVKGAMHLAKDDKVTSEAIKRAERLSELAKEGNNDAAFNPANNGFLNILDDKSSAANAPVVVPVQDKVRSGSGVANWAF